MNVAFIITAENHADVLSAAKDFAEKQTEKVNGLLCVSTDSEKYADLIIKITNGIFPSAIKCIGHPNHGMGKDSVICSLFHNFIATAYSRVPGAWMVYDGNANHLIENPVHRIDILYKKYGKPSMGFNTSNGSVIPSCPVILGSEDSRIGPPVRNILHPWRFSLRWVFAIDGEFHQTSGDEWPFGEVGEPVNKDVDKKLDYSEMSDDDLRLRHIAVTGRKAHHMAGREKMIKTIEDFIQ